MKINFNDLSIQNKIIKKNLLVNLKKIFNHGKYILGPEVQKLEKKLKKYTDSKYCLTTSSGTDSLLIALMALNIEPNDEVITTPFTYISTAEVILRAGARPVFADISLKDYNIDINSLKSKISKKTKAIIVVSLFGQTADIKNIKKIAKKIPIIEDGAQSFGAKHHGVKSCNLTTIGCTSFFPSKALGCYGDGGAIFTNNKSLYIKMKMIKQHGQNKKKYKYEKLGISARLDTIQAAVVLEKLKILDIEIDKRKKLTNYYKKNLQHIDDIQLPIIKKYNHSNYSIFSVLIKKKRNLFINYLKKKNIPSIIYYPIPLDYSKVFKKFSHIKSTPNAKKISKSILSLPISPYLRKDEREYIVKSIKNFFQK